MVARPGPGCWQLFQRLAGHAVVVALALDLLWPATGVSQPAPTFIDDPKQVTPLIVEASVSHAAAKGITLRVASALKKLAIFSSGTGSLTTGAMLTVITTVSGYVIYVANEYLWDLGVPNTNVRVNNESFDTLTSIWRNTAKYLTLKPVGMAVSWSIIYWYTGSWTATLAMGSISSLTGPLLFYANNLAWDWYDWSTAPPELPK